MPVPAAVTVVETEADWTLLLPLGLRSPGLARAAVRPVLARWGLGPDVADAVVLVASELVTDSVVHGATAPVLRLARDDAGVRVSVSDADPGAPTPGAAGPEAEGGRGLLLVDALAREWGTVRAGQGKVVWADLGLAVAG